MVDTLLSTASLRPRTGADSRGDVRRRTTGPQHYRVDGRETDETTVSHEGMVASRSRVSRRTSTESPHPRCVTLAFRNLCVLLEGRRSKHGLSTNDSTRIYRHTEQAQRSLVGSYDCRSQERHEEPHSTVWIVVQGRLLRCALEHLRHLSVRESLALDPDKKATEKARTFTDIVCNDFKFSSGTHADLRSQPDSPDGPEPRHHHGKNFSRASSAESGTTSSGAKLETKSTAEPTVIPSATKMKNTTSVVPNTNEPEHITITDETLDNQSHDMETDDNATYVLVPETQPNSATHTSQDLPQSAFFTAASNSWQT